MRPVKLLALLTALMLVLAACGNDSEDVSEEEDDTDVTAPAEDEEEVDERGAELDDDVAALVNDEEIPASAVEEQVETLSANPELAEALEGEDAELTMGVLQAQILTTLIVREVALAAAEDLDVPVTDEDIEEARAEVEAEAGGAEGLADELEQGGMSEEQLAVELRGIAAIRNIQEALAEEDDAEEEGDAEDPEAPEGAPDPAELRAQQHVRERLLAADVVVNDDYGTWDAENGQVLPPGGLPQAPQAPQPPPDPDAEPES